MAESYAAHQAQHPGRGPYIVTLLYAEPPVLDHSALQARLRDAFGDVDVVGDDASVHMFALKGRGATLPDGRRAPVIVAVSPSEIGDLTPSLGQSWDWPLARDVASRAHHALAVHDMVTLGLDGPTRVDVFDLFLRTVMRSLPPLAMHWLASERVVEPEAYLRTGKADGERLTKGYVNVRLFRVEGRAPEECVMDTLGLASFGLPDLQCHFAGLDPSQVARMLFNTAIHVFENGDVIDDGHTLEGVIEGSRWPCQHEAALVAPERVVVDINPGGARPKGP
jgi:hypothetical protein